MTEFPAEDPNCDFICVSKGAKRRLKPTISRSLPVFAMTSTIRSSFLASQREWLFYEDGLPGLKRTTDQVRVRMVAGHDEDSVQGRVLEHGVGVGRCGSESETPLGVNRGKRPGRRDMREEGIVQPGEVR